MLSPNLTSKFVFSSAVVLTFIQVPKLQNSIQEYNHQLYNVLRDVKKKKKKMSFFFHFILIFLMVAGYLVSQCKMMFEQQFNRKNLLAECKKVLNTCKDLLILTFNVPFLFSLTFIAFWMYKQCIYTWPFEKGWQGAINTCQIPIKCINILNPSLMKHGPLSLKNITGTPIIIKILLIFSIVIETVSDFIINFSPH